MGKTLPRTSNTLTGTMGASLIKKGKLLIRGETEDALSSLTIIHLMVWAGEGSFHFIGDNTLAENFILMRPLLSSLFHHSGKYALCLHSGRDDT